ncbi:N-acetyl-1-D-myo-inositol-2-amino-2-deoxy-alpha-D-glucopyranoside deacetylase [Mycobacterium sp.]|uniref:N-acetyl-1-D-myo-inositol-2-amino-2-deoxy-alpha- D-glucopyranoside deacetylase n=1 Tax=Mycobacterium sp. TaxID=1785 RepID=UPI003C77A7BC
MSETPRLLFVHAHPDDESLSNGATIAHYTARGARVWVVTCTLGEEGEVIGDRWAQLAVDRADQLGGYRIGELTAALHALGVSEPIYLGGAGRWRDSGMRGTPTRRRQRFIDADEREAVGALVAIIREQCPHVVVTYDPQGGYGHPDHVHTHTVTTAAVASSGFGAGAADYPGEPWTVPKFYWSVFAMSAFTAGRHALNRHDLRPEWTLPPQEEFDFGYADENIDAVVEAGEEALAAKTAALAAHATQVVVGPTGRACALSNSIALPILGQEHYVLAAGDAGDRDGRGWETDLLAGLGFTAP